MTRIELGCPGHFIGAADCGFRRHTQVGRWRVSTIGDYRPRVSDDDERPRQRVGFDRYYETMAFPLDERGRVTSWNEAAVRGYDTAEDAQAGHEEMVAMALRCEL